MTQAVFTANTIQDKLILQWLFVNDHPFSQCRGVEGGRVGVGVGAGGEELQDKSEDNHEASILICAGCNRVV